MAKLDYQRLVIGYHGCDESMVEKVLLHGADLEYSENPFDWLGKGIYFWEHGPERALEWAQRGMKLFGHIKKPSVIGAYINLGHCFDLLDIRNTTAMREIFPTFCDFCKKGGTEIPQNKAAPKDPSEELVMRYLDCAVINWYLDQTAKLDISFQTVRGAFVEGGPAFAGSRIMLKSHVQIAVRDKSCILGYFRPRMA